MGFTVESLGSSFTFGFMVVFRTAAAVHSAAISCLWALLQSNLLSSRDAGLVMKDLLTQVCVVNINLDAVTCTLVHLQNNQHLPVEH